MENDYDEDGNNIVPCPMCLDVHCRSKEIRSVTKEKCPEEDEFIKHMNHEETIKGMKEKKCTVTFIGERYEQLERLSKGRGSKLLVVIKALDLLEQAKNV